MQSRSNIVNTSVPFVAWIILIIPFIYEDRYQTSAGESHLIATKETGPGRPGVSGNGR